MRKNRHVIIGTAGHVDHGKTELVRALTGVNTDRLREEQERGISIELGFAEMTLPSGDCVGLVDVPGHERFVRAMVAGAAGIDLGLLVVAADESVMPQTREHLEIMALLGLRSGVVAVTKCDLVDAETIEIVEAEIADLVHGTFLEGARVVHTSARTAGGLDALAAALDAVTATLPPKPTDTFFRLPVDRAFALSGVGVVVTGTAWSGRLREGDTVELLPSQRPARVRGVQVHGEKREAAFAGERIAINLHGVKLHDVRRGMMVVTQRVLQPAYMLDANVYLLPSFDRALRNRSRVRVHHGAAEVLARLVLLDRDALEPGDSAPAQLRLEEPLATDRGDHLVLRFYSPMRTLGGGRVLDPAPTKHKRYRDDVLSALELKESGSPRELVMDSIRRAQLAGCSTQEIEAARVVTPEQVETAVRELLDTGSAVQVGETLYDRGALREAAGEVQRLGAAHQRAHPLAWGIGRAELQERLGHRAPRTRFNELLEWLAAHASEAGGIHLRPDAVRVGSADRQLEEADRKALGQLEASLRQGGAAPPTVAELQKQTTLGPRFAAFVSLLEEQGSVVRITESLLYHREALTAIEAKLRALLASRDVMSMAEFKELTGLSRKYAVPLLEHFDRLGITARSGDVRKPGPALRTT